MKNMDFEYEIKNREVTITKFIGYAHFPSNNFYGNSFITVPSVIDGFPVTEIGDHVFNAHNSVYLPETLKKIGEGNFISKTKRGIERCETITQGFVFDVKDDGSVVIRQYVGNAENVTIPSEIAGMPVSEIGDTAFARNGKIKAITVPGSVKTIGYDAFWGCTNLTDVILSDGVKSIGRGTFDSCYKLENITIPDSVEKIGHHAFSNCPNLKNLTIPATAEVENENFEYEVGEDGNITITRYVGDYHDPADGEHTYVDIPSEIDGKLVKAIGKGAFQFRDDIVSIEIPDSITTIGDCAFEGTDIKNIVIPDGVESIGTRAFARCLLTSVDIPNSVTTLGKESFDKCRDLASAKVHNSISAKEAKNAFPKSTEIIREPSEPSKSWFSKLVGKADKEPKEQNEPEIGE